MYIRLHLATFLLRLSGIIVPLRQVAHKEADWRWTNAHNGAFHDIRKLVIPRAQRFYQPRYQGLLAGGEKANRPWE